VLARARFRALCRPNAKHVPDEGWTTGTCLYVFRCLLLDQNIVILLRAQFYSTARWCIAVPRRRRTRQSRVRRGATSGQRKSAWPNLHTYKAHSMCFRGRKSTQLRESLNPSLPQHPDDACGREPMDTWMVCIRWYNVTHTRHHTREHIYDFLYLVRAHSANIMYISIYIYIYISSHCVHTENATSNLARYKTWNHARLSDIAAKCQFLKFAWSDESKYRKKSQLIKIHAFVSLRAPK